MIYAKLPLEQLLRILLLVFCSLPSLLLAVSSDHRCLYNEFGNPTSSIEKHRLGQLNKVKWSIYNCYWIKEIKLDLEWVSWSGEL